MAHKLVGFADSSNSTQTEYIKTQLQAISDEFEDVTTELVNESDSRLRHYSKKSDRLPCIMLFKDVGKQAHIHAKLSNVKAIDWVRLHKG